MLKSTVPLMTLFLSMKGQERKQRRNRRTPRCNVFVGGYPSGVKPVIANRVIDNDLALTAKDRESQNLLRLRVS